MTFMADLGRMAIDCEFRATLDDALRDQFISGLRSKAMHKRLLTEDKLTLPRALEISTAIDSAAQNAKGFQESDPLTVKQVKRLPHQMHGPKLGTRQQSQTSASRYSMPSCKHCGKSNHSEAVCRFKHANCHKCGKKAT